MERRTAIGYGLGAILVSGLVGVAVMQHLTVIELRGEKQALQESVRQLDQNRVETRESRESPAPRPDQQAELEKLREDNKDLLRLRNEVRQLREQAAEIDVLRAANTRLLQGMQESGGLLSNRMASVTAVRKQGSVLGVNVAPANPPPGSAAPRYQGVTVVGVMSNAPAAQSDLKPGDIIIRLDGRPIESAPQLQVEMLTKKPGETVVLDVMRNDAIVRVPVQTRAWPE